MGCTNTEVFTYWTGVMGTVIKSAAERRGIPNARGMVLRYLKSNGSYSESIITDLMPPSS
jgi:hypothetical protein